METTQELDQLFINCRDKNYIKSNMDGLKSFFSTPQSINALKYALTTNRNFTALKIIEQLNLKIIPYIYINKFTFVSIFWLNRMKVIPNDEFEKLSRKFEILKDFDILYEETERNFISLQIEKRRRMHSHSDKTVNTLTPIERHLKEARMIHKYMKPCSSMSFVFLIDEVVDIEKITSEFADFGKYVFSTDLKTFEEFPDDPEKNMKAFKFRDVKMKLSMSSLRSFSQFSKMDAKQQERIEELMKVINKIRRCGFKYYICSYKALVISLTFCYLFMNNIDLTKIVEISRDLKLPENFPVLGRKVVVGKNGNVRYEDLDRVSESLRCIFRDTHSSDI